jgi:hypothetical protein
MKDSEVLEGVDKSSIPRCASVPLVDCSSVVATVRASLAIYNNRDDIDQLYQAPLTTRDYSADKARMK